jgi:hypothetical protein
MAPAAGRTTIVLVTMKDTSTNSPASIPTYASTAKVTTEAIPSFDLPLQALLCRSSSSDATESVLVSSELQNLSTKVHRLLSFENLAAPSETFQACALSLRTRVPVFLRRTEQFEPPSPCQKRSALALLRASHYVDRIQEGMDVDSSKSLDKQLRTVLSGLDAELLPQSFRNSLSFRLSSWVHGFDLPVGATARTDLDERWDQCPLVVEVEPVVEFRTDDATSVDYARRAAKACLVTIMKCRHIGCSIGSGAGTIGEATIRVHVTPIDGSLVDSQGNSLSLQIKEARV